MSNNNNNHTYSIDLDLRTPQASKQALKELQTAFEDSGKNINELNRSYTELSKYTNDQLTLEKQYNKIIAQRLSEKDKEIDKLQAEKVAIASNKTLTEAQKKEMIAIRDEQTANTSEFFSAVSAASSRKSSPYHLKEILVNSLSEPPSLKEKTMSTTIGA